MSSEDRRPHSRLPDDPAWWDDLAARSVRAALGDARSGVGASTGVAPLRRGGGDAWWRALSDSAFVLAASAVLALLGGALLMGERASARVGGEAFAAALAPEDPMLRALLGTSPAPDGAALLRLVALREEGQ